VPLILESLRGACAPSTWSIGPEETKELLLRCRSALRPCVVILPTRRDDLVAMRDLSHGLTVGPAELAQLLATAQQASAGLFSLRLQAEGVRAVSLSGSQTGLVLEGDPLAATFVCFESERVRPYLERNEVLVLAGLQGTGEDLAPRHLALPHLPLWRAAWEEFLTRT